MEEKQIKLNDTKKKKTTKKENPIYFFIFLALLGVTIFTVKYVIMKHKTIKNEMKPQPFEKLLKESLSEYRAKKSLFGVPVVINKDLLPIGPAPGPHTQLAGNLIAAYAAGATVFELKTVQVLSGEQLGIIKPCIYVGSEVYNTEWSTELYIKDAMNEYIKAALLIEVLSREFDLTPFDKLQFVMSIGYDFKGIKSEIVDAFIEGMKMSANTEEWIKDIEIIKTMKDQFKKFKIDDIKNFKKNLVDTVTLSTMHGCPAEDIEKIAKYLLTEKKLNTYIKMNPTLLGKERLNELLKAKGYQVTLPDAVFQSDIKMEHAKTIIKNCLETAKKEGKLFGVKLTNTLPSVIMNQELTGQNMYMSGPGLYTIALNAAYIIAKEFNGEIELSFSGGIDNTNIKDVLETGIKPITLASYLLRPKGYKNLSKLLIKATIPKTINLEKLGALAESSIKDKNTNKKTPKTFPPKDGYESTCAKCHNCEDICPNRANRRSTVNGKEVVLHDPSLCNECGACAFNCIMGHKPYKEKASSVEKVFFKIGQFNIGIWEIACFILVIIGLIGIIVSLAKGQDQKKDESKEGTELEDDKA